MACSAFPSGTIFATLFYRARTFASLTPGAPWVRRPDLCVAAVALSPDDPGAFSDRLLASTMPANAHPLGHDDDGNDDDNDDGGHRRYHHAFQPLHADERRHASSLTRGGRRDEWLGGRAALRLALRGMMRSSDGTVDHDGDAAAAAADDDDDARRRVVIGRILDGPLLPDPVTGAVHLARHNEAGDSVGDSAPGGPALTYTMPSCAVSISHKSEVAVGLACWHGSLGSSPGDDGTIWRCVRDGHRTAPSGQSHDRSGGRVAVLTAGVDVEHILPARPLGIGRRVLTERERAVVDEAAAEHGAERAWREVAVRFSLKEAFYKAAHPRLGRFIGFGAAEVDLDWSDAPDARTGAREAILRTTAFSSSSKKKKEDEEEEEEENQNDENQ